MPQWTVVAILLLLVASEEATVFTKFQLIPLKVLKAGFIAGVFQALNNRTTTTQRSVETSITETYDSNSSNIDYSTNVGSEDNSTSAFYDNYETSGAKAINSNSGRTHKFSSELPYISNHRGSQALQNRVDRSEPIFFAGESSSGYIDSSKLSSESHISLSGTNNNFEDLTVLSAENNLASIQLNRNIKNVAEYPESFHTSYDGPIFVSGDTFTTATYGKKQNFNSSEEANSTSPIYDSIYTFETESTPRSVYQMTDFIIPNPKFGLNNQNIQVKPQNQQRFRQQVGRVDSKFSKLANVERAKLIKVYKILESGSAFDESYKVLNTQTLAGLTNRNWRNP